MGRHAGVPGEISRHKPDSLGCAVVFWCCVHDVSVPREGVAGESCWCSVGLAVVRPECGYDVIFCVSGERVIGPSWQLCQAAGQWSVLAPEVELWWL